MAKPRRRADELLVARALADDLHRAQALILAGHVVAGERRVDKPGQPLAEDVPLRLTGIKHGRYVSRGGDKLQSALEALKISVEGAHCLDLGASTGGFCDCLLQHGAARVLAVDVGYGLLADKLRRDPRITLRERTHVRDLRRETLEFPVDFVTADLSFIALQPLLAGILALVEPGGRLLLMVKPQFEAARGEVGEGGVVRDDALRRALVQRVLDEAVRCGAELLGQADSQVAGPAGNREVFVLLRRPMHQS